MIKEFSELQSAKAELENSNKLQGKSISNLERKNIELVEKNEQLEDAIDLLRSEVNRLDQEKRIKETEFVNEIEKRDARYASLKKKAEHSSEKEELAAKDAFIKDLQSKIEELNENQQTLANMNAVLEASLRNQSQLEENFSTKLKIANEEIISKTEEIDMLKEEINGLKGQLSTLKGEHDKVLNEFEEKINFCTEKEEMTNVLRNQLLAMKDKESEKEDTIARIRSENEELQAKSSNLEKKCCDQKKELETLSLEMRELRTTLILALDSVTQTENLRKEEREKAQQEIAALEKKANNAGTESNYFVSTLLMIRSTAKSVFQSIESCKAISCTVSENFRQMMGEEFLSAENTTDLSITEQPRYIQQVLMVLFTEIKYLALKILEGENKILKLSAENYERQERLSAKEYQRSVSSTEDFRQNLRDRDLNRYDRPPSSDTFSSKNYQPVLDQKRKDFFTETETGSDLNSQTSKENHIVEARHSAKSSQERLFYQSTAENNGKSVIGDLFKTIFHICLVILTSQTDSSESEKSQNIFSRKMGKISMKNLRSKNCDAYSPEKFHEPKFEELKFDPISSTHNLTRQEVNCYYQQ